MAYDRHFRRIRERRAANPTQDLPMAHPDFLSLCQEIRDSIYTYALDAEVIHSNASYADNSDHSRKPSGAWSISYDETCPTATYLSLMLCCRQLYGEVKTFLEQAGRHGTTLELVVEAKYPDMTTHWSCIPRPPDQITDLVIDMRLRNYFDPFFNTAAQHDVLLRPAFDIIQRYVKHGPRLARVSPLRRPLGLRTIRIVISSAIPLEDLTYVFGNPGIQLALIASHFKALAVRLARSGLLTGTMGALEICLEGKEVERFPVTSNIWDEPDFVFFRDLGYRWDLPAKTATE